MQISVFEKYIPLHKLQSNADKCTVYWCPCPTDHHLEWFEAKVINLNMCLRFLPRPPPLVEHTGMYVMVTANSMHLSKKRC